MLKISSREISVVVQGPITKVTELCIASIRKFLPESLVILSTIDDTTNAYTQNLDYDEIILSPDIKVEYTTFLDGSKPNNINRQIISTLAGIRKVKTKYALKIRSGFILTGDGFLDYFDKFNAFNPEQRFFEKRILICTLFSKYPRKSKFIRLKGVGFPYHPSDFVQFGLTKDLLKLWDIDLVSDEDLNWFASRLIPKNEEPFRHRYAVEQQIFIQFMKKNKIEYFADFFYDRSEKNASHTDLIMANNFITLSFKKFCLKPEKKIFEINSQPYYSVCYTEKIWLNSYKKYCDKSIKTKLIDTEFVQALYFNWPVIFGIHRSYHSMVDNFKRSLESDEMLMQRTKSLFLSLFFLIKLLLKLFPRLIISIFSCLQKTEL